MRLLGESPQKATHCAAVYGGKHKGMKRAPGPSLRRQTEELLTQLTPGADFLEDIWIHHFRSCGCQVEKYSIHWTR